MLGQFLVEPELELELPELELELELEPLVLPVFELLDDGAVADEPVLELEPELLLGVELDVVAALATNAPPATRPVVNAPMASTLRKRMCMDDCLSSLVKRLPFGRYGQPAIPICAREQSGLGEWVESPYDSVTILR